MLIKLTEFPSEKSFYLDHRNVRLVQAKENPKPNNKKDDEKIIAKPQASTFLITYTMLPSGWQAFDLMDETDVVVAMVNAAYMGENPVAKGAN